MRPIDKTKTQNNSAAKAAKVEAMHKVQENIERAMFMYNLNTWCLKKKIYSNAFGIADPAFNSYIHGHVLPDAEDTRKLAKKLGCQPADLYAGTSLAMKQQEPTQPVEAPVIEQPVRKQQAFRNKVATQKVVEKDAEPRLEIVSEQPSKEDVVTVSITANLDYSKRPHPKRKWTAATHSSLERAFAETVRQNIRKYAAERGMTLTGLRKVCKVGNSINTLLYREDRMPTQQAVEELALVFGVTPEQMSGTQPIKAVGTDLSVSKKTLKFAAHAMDDAEEFRKFVIGVCDNLKPEDFPAKSQARIVAKADKLVAGV